ncbi:S1/P1 nuclease [Undibacterium piscinae]|uniref:S1/P1 nuclease n=1 Tax=Undibacterium piscinae TaxID=2495591 RepID=A0A6M4A7U0_9BURK|nr:S1/P1 nuclease [Undibacterium piscinae]
MKLRIITTFLFSMCCLPATSMAWGPDGHQSIAAIADKLLSGSAAEKEISKLLNGGKLEQIAVWADCVKGISPEKDFAYTSIGRYPECAAFENKAGIAEMSAYVRKNHSNCNPAFDQESCHKQYHYADVALQHGEYKTGYVGTSDHDIVHAIKASVRVLQGKPQAKPFQFQDQREALMLLTHFIGDLHQPLHVGSVFLNADGKVVNPDDGHYDHGSNTVGGNALQYPCGNLHSMWDDLPPQFKRGRMNEELSAKAKAIIKPEGNPERWPTLWANDAILNASILFKDTQFSKSTPNQRGNSWSIALPLEYEKTMLKIKEESLIKAGAHLAQLLQTIWPD